MSSPAHACPSDELLFGFAEGLLSAEQRGALERHIAGCPDCAMVVGASLSAPQPLLLDRYEIQGELGRGGMGRVVRALDTALQREVAIKFLLASALGGGGPERFVREARALAELRHPHVVEVFDIGQADGDLFFVMELVEGTDLAAWSRDRGWDEVLACLEDAGRGLAAAHARGFLHRDFKPSNVLVDDTGRAKVGDFGLVGEDRTVSTIDEGLASGPLTQPGVLMGTLPYMAPELLDARPATVRSDQFAFCVTAWEVLHGARPFAGRTLAEHRVSRRRGPQAPSDRRRVPKAIVETLQRGLSPDPQERFPSMEALLTALRPRRGRALWFGAAALGLVSLAATAAASPRMSHCAERAERRAERWMSTLIPRLHERSEDARSHQRAAIGAASDRLSTKAQAWVAARVEACSPDSPTARSDRRAACLDRWADQVERTLSTSAESDLRVDRIPTMLDAMDDPTRCGSEVVPQTAPLLDAALADAELRLHAHQWGPLKAKLDTIADAVLERDAPHLVAKYRLLEGRALIETGEATRGMARLEDGFITASRAGLHALAARNAHALLLQASVQVDTHAVDRWARYAHLHAERSKDPQLEVTIAIAHARALVRRSAPQAAHAMLEDALAKLPDAPTNASVDATGLLARLEFSFERHGQARERLEQHLALAAEHYGPEHPKLRGTLTTLLELDIVQGVTAQTDARLQRLRTITDQAYAAQDPRHAEVHMMAGSVAMAKDRPADALEAFRAGTKQLEGRDGEPMLRLSLLNGVADAYDALDDGAAALEIRQQLVDAWTAEAGADSIYTARFEVLLGEALIEQGRTDEGIEALRDAIAVLERNDADGRVGLLVARTVLGDGLAGSGRNDEARRVLELAVREADPERGSPGLRAEAMFTLAKVVADSDPERARALAEDARELAEGTRRETIDAWLRDAR